MADPTDASPPDETLAARRLSARHLDAFHVRAEQRIAARTDEPLRQAMDQTPGLTRETLLRQLSKLTRAKRAVVIQHEGEVTDIVYVEDHAIQRAAVRDAMELRGEFPAAKLDVRAQVFSVERIEPLRAELAAARAEGRLSHAELLALAGVSPDIVEAERVIEIEPMPPPRRGRGRPPTPRP